MADFVANIAKGRTVEFYNRVKSNDPANSALVVVLLAATGIETDVGQALEIDTGRAVTRRKTRALGLCEEVDTAGRLFRTTNLRTRRSGREPATSTSGREDST